MQTRLLLKKQYKPVVWLIIQKKKKYFLGPLHLPLTLHAVLGQSISFISNSTNYLSSIIVTYNKNIFLNILSPVLSTTYYNSTTQRICSNCYVT